MLLRDGKRARWTGAEPLGDAEPLWAAKEPQT